MASPRPTTSLSSTVAAFVHAAGYADLPGEVTRITRQHLLDTIGCCLAAAKAATPSGRPPALVSSRPKQIGFRTSCKESANRCRAI